MPILRVSDVAVSKDYYTRVLGFKVDFEIARQIRFGLAGQMRPVSLRRRSGPSRNVGLDQRTRC